MQALNFKFKNIGWKKKQQKTSRKFPPTEKRASLMRKARVSSIVFIDINLWLKRSRKGNILAGTSICRTELQLSNKLQMNLKDWRCSWPFNTSGNSIWRGFILFFLSGVWGADAGGRGRGDPVLLSCRALWTSLDPWWWKVFQAQLVGWPWCVCVCVCVCVRACVCYVLTCAFFCGPLDYETVTDNAKS